MIAALLLLPAAAFSQELSGAKLDAMPEAEASADAPVRRPDPQRIMSELSTGLRLSSKQEDRISSAVKKKASEFDKLMKDYEKYTAEEKKWRIKANEARYGMVKINRDMPDAVREYLDDEQRESFDELVAASRKPSGVAAPAPKTAPKPVKRKLIRRKKAVVPAKEEAGEVMVDGDVEKPAPKKRLIKRKKAGPEPQERGEQGFPPGSRNNPAAAALAEEELDEDAGSYP
jgi:hypothetical protein